jgi:NTP pyrophosphatase (non-canonical NTP hydrolase)
MDDLWKMSVGQETMQTLRHLTIEETYELGDAIWQWFKWSQKKS